MQIFRAALCDLMCAGTSLLVARGSAARPVFETITLPTKPPKSAAIAVIALQPLETGALLPAGAAAAGAVPQLKQPDEQTKGKVAQKRTAADVSVIGPGSEHGGVPAALRTAALPPSIIQQPQQQPEQMEVQQGRTNHDLRCHSQQLLT